MTSKGGNANRRAPIASSPVLTTEFERQVRRLQLTAEMYISSAALRTWCEQNKDRCYVPEWLLAKWGNADGSGPHQVSTLSLRVPKARED